MLAMGALLPKLRAIGRLRAGIYLLILLTTVGQTAISPLIPSYEAKFALSSATVGLVLGLPGLSTLAVAIPAGSLADRFGARRLTLLAALVISAALAGQALAPDLGLLLVARLVFGAGYGMLWTAGLAWLPPTRRVSGRSGLGGTVVSAGLGAIVGPVFSGMASQYLGIGAPFLVTAVVVAVVAVVLSTVPAGERRERRPDLSFVEAMQHVTSDGQVVTAVAIIIVAGIVYSVTSLFAPIELHAAGWSTGSIGLAFSIASGLFVLGSASAMSLGRRIVTIPAALAAATAAIVAIALGGLSVGPLVIVALLAATATSRSVLWTIAYPLGEEGARRAEVGVGVVLGFLNAVSAATTFVVPLLAGSLAATVGPRGSYDIAVLASIGIIGCWWLRRRAAAAAPAVRYNGSGAPPERRVAGLSSR